MLLDRLGREGRGCKGLIRLLLLLWLERLLLSLMLFNNMLDCIEKTLVYNVPVEALEGFIRGGVSLLQ